MLLESWEDLYRSMAAASCERPGVCVNSVSVESTQSSSTQRGQEEEVLAQCKASDGEEEPHRDSIVRERQSRPSLQGARTGGDVVITDRPTADLDNITHHWLLFHMSYDGRYMARN